MKKLISHHLTKLWLAGPLCLALLVGPAQLLAVETKISPLVAGKTNFSPASTSPAPPEFDLESLKKQAETGDAAAQFNLALQLSAKALEAQNDQDKKDLTLASFQLLSRAADQGHPRAMTMIGHSYELDAYNLGGIKLSDQEDEDSAKDTVLARQWYQKAADHGDALGMIYLASLYAKGEGGPKDLAAAQQLIKMALANPAGQKDKDVLESLAKIFEKGEIVPQDQKQAAILWDKAAQLAESETQSR
ncbi:MAG: sel1 repeat family protein [Deltaproteobacteria bacterium]|jgi:TPR repeat protein|nr:sel1 repeat family protein [Deltaproteobacteria bacterium]